MSKTFVANGNGEQEEFRRGFCVSRNEFVGEKCTNCGFQTTSPLISPHFWVFAPQMHRAARLVAQLAPGTDSGQCVLFSATQLIVRIIIFFLLGTDFLFETVIFVLDTFEFHAHLDFL